jgi:hypothetical protein
VVLGGDDRSSSLAASMPHSMFIAIVSHIPELKTELDVLGSGCSADLIEHKVDAILIQVCMASDLLASHVPSSVARNPPDGVGE